MKYLNSLGSNLPMEAPPPGVPVPASLYPGFGESELNVAKYLSVLRKNLWVIAGIVLCSTLVAALTSVRSPKIYEAVAKLNIEREPPQILNFKEILGDSFDYEMYIETQIRILQSNTLALKTLQDMKLASKAGFVGEQAAMSRSGRDDSKPWSDREEYSLINRFLGGLRVVRVRGSQIVEIHFQCYDPALAAGIANKLSDNFIQHNLQVKYQSTVDATSWLAGQIEDLKRKVEKSEEDLVAYERANSILLLDEKSGRSTTLDNLADVNKNFTAAQWERTIAEARWKTLKEQGTIPAIVADANYTALGARTNDLNQQLAEAEQQYGVNHPKYIRLKALRDQVAKDLEKEKKRLASQVESDFRTTVVKEENARRLFEKAKAEAESQNDKSIHYNILKRDVESNRGIYDGLLQRLKEAGVSAGLRSSNIQLIDPAKAPFVALFPKTGQNVSLGVIIGLMIGLGAAFLREYLDNTVKTPDDVEQYAHLPNLGVIPGISPGLVRAAYYAGYGMGQSKNKQLTPGQAAEAASAAAAARSANAAESGETSTALAADAKPILGMCRPETVALTHPHSSIAESFRALRTALLLANSGMPPRTILITSGLPSEGKTTIAINVAITLAQRGGRVLLMDGDLRRPSVQRHVTEGKRVRSLPGLSHYLTGNATLEEVIRPSDLIANLEMMFAGSIPPNPAELCSSEQMRKLLTNLRETYSHVVIDSPPLLSVTDATVLSVQADGVLLVSRSGFSTRDSLRRSKKMLEHVNARLLGVVLNDLNLAVDGYYYYYYYGYYGYGRPEREARNVAGR